MKVLITGATGFVGAATVRRALLAGHEVAVLIRPSATTGRLAPVLNRVRVLSADLRDEAATADAIAAARPEAVLHLAWSGVANSARNDPAQIHDNIGPTCRLLQLCAGAGVRKFVGLGSQAEYGPLDRTIREDDTPAPTTLYGVSKLSTAMLCDTLAAQLGIEFAWLRLFSTYGPGDSDVWLIPSIIRQLLLGQRPKTTAGTQVWDYLFVDDVADGVLATAVAAAARGRLNLGSGMPVQIRQLIETIRDMIDPAAEIGFGEIPFRPDQVMHMQADNSRLRRLSGWAPQVHLRDGLARTIADMRTRLDTASTTKTAARDA